MCRAQIGLSQTLPFAAREMILMRFENLNAVREFRTGSGSDRVKPWYYLLTPVATAPGSELADPLTTIAQTASALEKCATCVMRAVTSIIPLPIRGALV